MGTRRYMAPEVLDGTLKKDSFEAFLHADVYSFGLVLWELCRRTVTGDKTVSQIFLKLQIYVSNSPEQAGALAFERQSLYFSTKRVAIL